MAVYGVDFCSLQGQIDAGRMKLQGDIDFAYVQATSYGSSVDANFHKYIKQCSDAGIAYGAYHFAWQGGDPIAQMLHFATHADYVGAMDGELPPAIDWEACSNIPVKVCVDWLIAAAKEAKRLWFTDSTRKVVIYTYPNFAITHYPIPDELLQYADLWLAGSPHYINAAKQNPPWIAPDDWKGISPVKPWDKCLISQFSGNGGVRVPGCNVDIDRDMFFGSHGEFDAWRSYQRPVDSIVLNGKD